MATDTHAAPLPAPAPIILRDGTTAWLRPARPDDVERLAALFGRASRESLWLRFFTPTTHVDRRQVERMVDIDGVERMTYLVTRDEGEDEQVIAIGSLARLPNWDSAEVAFFVDDRFQGKGLGTLLLERLAEHARRAGILTLVADVLSDNHRMLEVFRKSGFELRMSSDIGVLHVKLPASPGEEARIRAEARERIATAASLNAFFRPRSVAVIGASREPRAIGRIVLDNLVRGRFEGPVYPINPSARSVGAIRAYPSVLDVPDDVDLAVVAVPARLVPQTVAECARKGVRALVVLTAGFAEVGAEGRAVQDELVRTVRAHGMRMVGPNCFGLLNTSPGVRLNATFSPIPATHGRVAMSSQSGALGLAILDYAGQLGLGLSMFVSVGNKADVSGNDLLQFWEEDPETNLIILYLESFGNPRKFARIARRVGRTKPVLAVKSGRSSSGSRAASSHTAALAGSDIAVDALFHQAGVIRADTLEELFDVASVLANQPLPAGNRVAVVTNAGGPGILAADACEAYRLSLPALAPETVTALRAALPATAAFGNPIDMIASASAAQYEETVRRVLADPHVDALIAIFIPAGLATTDEVAEAIRRGIIAAHADTGSEGVSGAEPPSGGGWGTLGSPIPNGKPVIACIMSSRERPAALSGDGDTPATRAIPSFRFPEPAARALARAVSYADWRRRPLGQVIEPPGVDGAAARAAVAGAIEAHGDGWLRPDEVDRLLAAAGIRTPRAVIAPTPAQAGAAAEAMGRPVAVKIVSSQLTHKSEVGGVALGLSDAESVRLACEGMLARAGDAPVDGFLVQEMVEGGVEVIVGVTQDPTFGPLVGFGLGGTAVEVLNDVVFRITPLTDADTHEMVRSIRGLPLLEGFRGRPAADIAAIEDLLQRVSWLVEQVPGIAEMDLNPLKVFEPGQGLLPVDARVYVRR